MLAHKLGGLSSDDEFDPIQSKKSRLFLTIADRQSKQIGCPEISMTLLRAGCLIYLALLFATFPSGRASESQKDGMLIVRVTGDDVDKSPVNNVYIEAFGFVNKYASRRSFILKSSAIGTYESSLPPGIYNVFVSDTSSFPSCKRVVIKPGSRTEWNVALEFDHINSNK